MGLFARRCFCAGGGELAFESIGQNIPLLKFPEIPTAGIKIETLEDFDNSRHRIIHGRYFSRPIRAVEDQIQFAKLEASSVLNLVAHAHDLLSGSNPHAWPTTMFGTLRVCVVLRREFSEFFDMMREQFANDKLQ